MSSGEIHYFDESAVRNFIANNNHEDQTPNQSATEINDYIGEIVAILDDNHNLIIRDASFLRNMMCPSEFPYWTAAEYAELNGRKVPIILRHCREKRIPGAINVGSSWFIPKGTVYPKDQRAGRDMSKRDYKAKKV